MKFLPGSVKYKKSSLARAKNDPLRMEVLILKLIMLAALALHPLPGALANSNIKQSLDLAKEDVPFKLNYSPLDHQYGKDLITFYNALLKNDLNKTHLKKLLTYKNKHHSFKGLDATIERAENISSITNQDGFYSICTVKNKNIDNYSGSLAEKLENMLDRYCRYRYLKDMQQTFLETDLSPRELAFLKETAPFFVTDDNQAELVSFLKYFKGNKTQHEKISNVLIDEYVNLKIKPSSAVLAQLKVNGLLNKFLQNNLHLDESSNQLFQKEFQQLIKKSQIASSNGDYVVAKQLIISALNFYSKNKKFIDQRRAWVDTTNAGKALYYIGRDSDAIEIFTLSRAIAPKEEVSEANFYLLWPHLINKDYAAMKATIDKNGLEKTFDQHHAKLKYWIAYALLKTGNAKKAGEYFNNIVNSTPYSFYSIIALKELAALNQGLSKDEILAKLITKSPPPEFKMEATSDILKDSLRRFAVWKAIGQENFGVLEIRHIESLSKENTFKDADFSKIISPESHKEFIVLNLIRLLHGHKDFLTAFKIFQNTLAENSQTLNYRLIKYIFPLSYFNIIKKNADSLDPLIVMSLIRQESAFNPEATSLVGAKGLMQLMPETAKRFNRKVKLKHLGNPEINVALGSKYLKQLLTRFDGNLIYALASYNAGENRIDRWKKEIFRNDDPLATIESIPFEETRNYVKLIYRNNFFYSLLSDRPVLTKPLDETFKVSVNIK